MVKLVIFIVYSNLLILSDSCKYINEYYQVNENSFHKIFYLELDNNLISYSTVNETFYKKNMTDARDVCENCSYIHIDIDYKSYPILKLHFRSSEINISGTLSFETKNCTILKETAVLMTRNIE